MIASGAVGATSGRLPQKDGVRPPPPASHRRRHLCLLRRLAHESMSNLYISILEAKELHTQSKSEFLPGKGRTHKDH